MAKAQGFTLLHGQIKKWLQEDGALAEALDEAAKKVAATANATAGSKAHYQVEIDNRGTRMTARVGSSDEAAMWLEFGFDSEKTTPLRRGLASLGGDDG